MPLIKAQVLAGYSRPSNTYNKAQSENGWSTLETKLLLQYGEFASLGEARL